MHVLTTVNRHMIYNIDTETETENYSPCLKEKHCLRDTVRDAFLLFGVDEVTFESTCIRFRLEDER